MGLRLKKDIDIEQLRKYGFKTGKEWADQGERCLIGEGYKYQHGWYHKFLMDEEDPNKILYANEEYDQPVVKISVRTEKDVLGNEFLNNLYIDCTPWCTYHIGGSDLDIVTETIFDLAKDGLLEKAESK